MTRENPERDELLQRFLDGDLDPREAEHARKLLASDAEFRTDAESYRRLGDLVRELAQSEGFEADVDRMWERVSSGVRERASDDIARPGAGRVWFSEFFAHRKRYWIPTVGMTVAAAAAAVVLAFYLPPPEVAVPVTAPAELGSRVTDISLNSASTLVLEVETESGGTAAVLWVTDEEAAEEDEEPEREGDFPEPPVEEP